MEKGEDGIRCSTRQVITAYEAKYIRPLLKSPKDIKRYSVHPSREAFCCSDSINQLKKLGHTGAWTWIKKFETETNANGVPLKDKLGSYIADCPRVKLLK